MIASILEWTLLFTIFFCPPLIYILLFPDCVSSDHNGFEQQFPGKLDLMEGSGMGTTTDVFQQSGKFVVYP
jgi:hypothetical protein